MTRWRAAVVFLVGGAALIVPGNTLGQGSYNPTGGRRTLQFFSDGSFLLAYGRTDVLTRRYKGWVIDPGNRRTVGPLEHADGATEPVFSPDGTHVLTASHDHTAAVWDATTGKRVFEVKHFDRVYDATYSPDGTRFVTASADERAIIWDAHTGQKLVTLQHEHEVRRATFSSEGTRVVTSADDADPIVWDARTGQLLKTEGTEKEAASDFGVLSDGGSKQSPDGRTLIAFRSGKLTIKDVRTGQQVCEAGINRPFIRAEFSPDGNRLLLITEDPQMAMLDVRTGARTPLRWK